MGAKLEVETPFSVAKNDYGLSTKYSDSTQLKKCKT